MNIILEAYGKKPTFPLHKEGLRPTLAYLMNFRDRVARVDPEVLVYMTKGTKPDKPDANGDFSLRCRLALDAMQDTMSSGSKAILSGKGEYDEAQHDLKKYYDLFEKVFKSETTLALQQAAGECWDDLFQLKQGETETVPDYLGRGASLGRELMRLKEMPKAFLIVRRLAIGLDPRRYGQATQDIVQARAECATIDELHEFIAKRTTFVPDLQANKDEPQLAFLAEEDDSNQCFIAHGQTSRQMPRSAPNTKQEHWRPTEAKHRLVCTYCDFYRLGEQRDRFNHSLDTCPYHIQDEKARNSGGRDYPKSNKTHNQAKTTGQARPNRA